MTAPDPLPDNDYKKCGAGRKAECCRFLIFDVGGFHCARDHMPALAAGLSLRTNMTASRTPDAEYPLCQLTLV